MFGRKGLRAAALLAGFALCGGAAWGQAVFGSLYGTVTDTTGAVVPNADVTVTDTNKGTVIAVKSNESGEYKVDHLIPDVYAVKVVAQGFKTFEATGIVLNADTAPKVDASLTIGGAGETVSVSADAIPQLKVDRADVSTIFSGKEFVDLPIPNRNFTALQLLLPGAQQLGWSHAASENPQGSLQIEVDGQAFAGVAFSLDGTDNQDPILGIIVVNPNADSLSETKITTQNFDAEFGKAVSSVVTAQTKSGTNSFHGSAFDYRQSNANLARDPFSQGGNSIFPAGLKNQFGGSIGGPIVKDKVFFFGDYQGVRQKSGISFTQTVPSSLLVSSCLTTQFCDFSEYANAQGVADKVANPAGYQLIYNNSGGSPVAYAGNRIPVSQVSTPALNLLKLLQPYAPNRQEGGAFSGLRNNYSGGGTGGLNSDQWDVRGDWQATGRTHVFGRFSRFTDTLTGKTLFGDAGGAGFGLGGYGGTSKGANDSVAAGVDVALNDKLVTDLRLGYFRYNIGTSKYDGNVAFADELGAPGLNTGTNFTAGAPAFGLTDAGGFGGPPNNQSAGPQYGSGLSINRCNCPLVEREDQFQIVNNWTKTIGNHAVKFGADLRYARNLRVPSDTNRTGQINFGTGPTSNGVAGSDTGLGFASFLLGDATFLGRYVSTTTNAKEFQKRDFFYAQDTWRASQKLTVNAGLRYELYFPESVNGKGNGALLNLATGYLQVAGYGNIGSNMNYNLGANTYNPRIGLTYQATPSIVVRAGYGRSFDIGVFGSIFGHSATQNLPVLASQSVSAAGGDTATDTTPAFQLSVGPPAPTFPAVPASGLLPSQGALVNARSRPTTLRLPTLDAWNFSIQQSLTPTLSLTMAYVGNKGTHTFGDASSNTTNPNEFTNFLPAVYSVTGSALHYDPSVGGSANPQTINGQIVTGIAPDGGTSQTQFLQRYYGLQLPACSDPNYIAGGGKLAPNGGCGWNQGITYFGDDQDTHYNALQASIAKQFAHGFSLNANYAWQQAISEASGYSTWDRDAVRGRDSALRQQQIIVYGLFQLPFGRNKQFLGNANGIVNQLVAGWELNPIVNYSSGLPFTLGYNACTASNVSGAPCYPDGDPGRLNKTHTGYPGGPNGLQFFQQVTLGTNGFSAPAVDHIGNVGRSSSFGPRYFNTDLSVMKNFPIRESIALQFRTDAFNVFNHINWGTPNGNIESGGQITNGAGKDGSANPRQLQFSARVQF